MKNNSSSSTDLSYSDSGVNINTGEELINAIKPATKQTNRKGVMGNIGGFGALFDLKKAGYSDPILVSGTDGVGTKLLIAIEASCLEFIGKDLVGMCVNDLIVQGAEPLFFLDYLATGKLEIKTAEIVIKSIAQAAKESNCALIGGETAEMPGLYSQGHFDLAGFCVGAVEKNNLLPSNIEQDQTVIALPSSGAHSNGFSLIRKVVEKTDLSWSDLAPFDQNKTLAKAFLEPTKLYTNIILNLHSKKLINGCAHITGGGLPGNLPRILPPNIAIEINNIWPIPEMFKWLAQTGPISNQEMLKVFNCGIGMVIITSQPESVMKILKETGEKGFVIGKTIQRKDNESQFQLNTPIHFK